MLWAEVLKRFQRISQSKNKMAKNQIRDIKVDKVKKKRKGVHSKCKTSHSKKSKNYKKKYRGQGKN